MIAAGTYNEGASLTGDGSVYEKAETGSLIVALMVAFPGGEQKKYTTTIYSKDAGISDKSVQNIRDIITEWNGADLNDLHDILVRGREIFAGREVVPVVIDDTYNGKAVTKIKYLNPKGSNALPPPADASTIMKKYGAQFRAKFGGTPVKPAAKAPAAPSKAAPKAPSAPPKPAKVSSQEACWQRLNDLMDNAEETEVTAAWFEYCGKAVPGKEQNEFTPEEWGRVLEVIDTETLPH